DYINLFETTKDLVEGNSIAVDLNGYKVGGLTFSKKSFIDFGNITKYKQTWYAWVRRYNFHFFTYL
ncbi:MAG: hypothetical protein ACLU8F_02980, partial [Clostridia bacterium]